MSDKRSESFVSTGDSSIRVGPSVGDRLIEPGSVEDDGYMVGITDDGLVVVANLREGEGEGCRVGCDVGPLEGDTDGVLVGCVDGIKVGTDIG